MALITFKGTPIQTVGTLPAVGTRLPTFSLAGKDLNDLGPADFEGKTLILNIVPSLDTSVCQKSARAFNEKASAMSGVVVLNISMDLPFAMGRFCESEGLSGVVNLSGFRAPTFGTDFGVYIAESGLRGLYSRAVIVANAGGQIVYTEQVPEIAQEPNYDAALAAAGA